MGVPGDDPPVIRGVLRKDSGVVGVVSLVHGDQWWDEVGAEIHVVDRVVTLVWVAAGPPQIRGDANVGVPVVWHWMRGGVGWVVSRRGDG